jgi:uncharacterized protein (TIGR02391 family)
VDTAAPIGEKERIDRFMRQRMERPLSEALAWVIAEGLLVPAPDENGRNGYFMLSRKAEGALADGSIAPYMRAAAFPRELLHPFIADRVWMALARNEFDTAVFHAFRAVEEAVRDAGGFDNKDIGVPLMRKAFDPAAGPLTDKKQTEAEREALAHLFAGAIGSYKNPHSHRTVVIEDIGEAQEQVMLASHLLRIVDSRRPKQS